MSLLFLRHVVVASGGSCPQTWSIFHTFASTSDVFVPRKGLDPGLPGFSWVWGSRGLLGTSKVGPQDRKQWKVIIWPPRVGRVCIASFNIYVASTTPPQLTQKTRAEKEKKRERIQAESDTERERENPSRETERERKRERERICLFVRISV
jgi:hypothetical protein